MVSTVSTEQEIAQISMEKPHVVLLGAGASRAALPTGDKYGRSVPLLREVARDLELFQDFPVAQRQVAETDFEAAYSSLVKSGNATAAATIDRKVRE